MEIQLLDIWEMRRFLLAKKWHPNFNGRRIAVEVVEMTEDRLTAWVEEVKE